MTRRKQTYETTEFAAMLGRMITAYGRRVGDADPEDLSEMLELHRRFEQIVGDAVRQQRERHGRSWADIGAAAGTTRQAAQMRWGKP